MTLSPARASSGCPASRRCAAARVDIDFGQLAEARVAVARAPAPTGNVDAVDLTLNLFDDVVLPAVVERSTATASGSGYVLSGRLDDVDGGTWKLFVYDGPVTGTVRTPTATFRIRTVDGVHVIYSVVNYNQELDHYTFAHELGHNMYLNHDRWAVVNVPEGGGDLDDPYPYSHGHISRNCGWRTIMAYPDRCLDDRVTRVPAIRNFSNPNRIHEDGERMGVFGDSPSSEVDGPADAVRSLNAKRRRTGTRRRTARPCSRSSLPSEQRGGLSATLRSFGTRCAGTPRVARPQCISAANA